MLADGEYQYGHAEVVLVKDGDTVVLRIDQGFRETATWPIRFKDFAAPEVTGPEKVEGLKWKAGLERILPIGTIVQLESFKTMTFDRFVGILWLNGGLVTNLLVAEMAKMLGEPKAILRKQAENRWRARVKLGGWLMRK